MMLQTSVVWLLALCAMALGCPHIVSRSQWGARVPKNKVHLKTPVPYVIVHYSAGSCCFTPASCSWLVRIIQRYHMDNWLLADIAYNFLIGEDGRIYEGRGWRTRGAHAENWNNKSLGISFLGNFSKIGPRRAALNAAKRLIQCAVSRNFLSRKYILKGLRNVKLTRCPGNALHGVIKWWPRFKA
ncbi:peptidoglycan-recognition protein SC2-like [Dermochelys coriacea]|uniref:peptidoglycan-recognition protein SC2-like n=1 Tax=Dermochelys coriacea TaxID=27794 RepID=UPI0018E8D204|nr:peptidoglycan-recognition protein SC2-like [Dermochelys coriacea]